jgi:hypothetical protein
MIHKVYEVDPMVCPQCGGFFAQRSSSRPPGGVLDIAALTELIFQRDQEEGFSVRRRRSQRREKRSLLSFYTELYDRRPGCMWADSDMVTELTPSGPRCKMHACRMLVSLQGRTESSRTEQRTVQEIKLSQSRFVSRYMLSFARD